MHENIKKCRRYIKHFARDGMKKNNHDTKKIVEKYTYSRWLPGKGELFLVIDKDVTTELEK